jgi:hypothetical protein
MARVNKSISRKLSYPAAMHKIKNDCNLHSKNKSSMKKAFIKHLIHPDYILFDWEFFSAKLGFE